MLSNNFDVIVLGAGAMGSAAAYQLAQEGKKVLLLEQFEIAHSRGSTHGESRIFRFAYTNLAYAELAFQCKELWRELEKFSNEKLLTILGGIDFAEDEIGKQNVLEVKNALKQLGSEFEELGFKELNKRYPQFNLSKSALAIYSPDTGVINPTQSIKVMVNSAKRLGAIVQDNEMVKEIRPSKELVEIITEKNHYKASNLIISVGGWTNKLLKYFDLELPLQVSQEQTVYFRPIRNHQLFTRENFPVWINYQGNIVYGIPSFLEPAIKVGFHHSGHYLDIIDYHQQINQEKIEQLRDYLKQYIPDLAGEDFGASTCIYTNTPDHDFLVDLLPNYPNVAIAAGFSGHGFKFSIGIGKALSDLLNDGKSSMRIEHLSIRRFLV
ncbi:MAG: N-methyl-L-tryptophan oxidase [Acidobacteria bacterium]|nr:N-methyl-L-tryptophan oxidase [Acidobacteriota bacterium]